MPKPAGTTVETQKALARQASTAAATQPGSSKALTQREQREIKRKEREAKEKEERERREREGGGKEEERRLWVCERCFKYMIDLPHWKAHQVGKDVKSRTVRGEALTRLLPPSRKIAMRINLRGNGCTNAEQRRFGKSTERRRKYVIAR